MNSFNKLIFAACLFLFFTITVQAQDQSISQAVAEVMELIDDQTPSLIEFQNALELHRDELEERKIVVKYHPSNKEVSSGVAEAVYRIEEYNSQARETISRYESKWYDQLKNIIAVYTRYGELKEATGGGATELDKFVKRHKEYMSLMSGVRSDIDYVAADCGFLRQ